MLTINTGVWTAVFAAAELIAVSDNPLYAMHGLLKMTLELGCRIFRRPVFQYLWDSAGIHIRLFFLVHDQCQTIPEGESAGNN